MKIPHKLKYCAAAVIAKRLLVAATFLLLNACIIPPVVAPDPVPPPKPQPVEVVRPETLMDYYHQVRNMDEASLAAEKEKLDTGALTNGAGAILLSKENTAFYSTNKSLKLLQEFRSVSGASISANEDAFLNMLESLLSERVQYSRKLASLREEQKAGLQSVEAQQAELLALQEQNQQLKEQLEQLKQIEQNINQRIQSLEPQE